MSIIGALHFEHGRQLPYGNMSTNSVPDSQITAGAKRGGSYGLHNTGAYTTWSINTANGEQVFHLGCAIKLTAVGSDTSLEPLLGVRFPNVIQIGQTNGLWVSRAPGTGDMGIYTSNGSTNQGSLLASAAAAWPNDGAWHWLTFDFRIANSGGSVAVGLDGAPIMSFAGDTACCAGDPVGQQILHIHSNSSNFAASMQDHYIDDAIMADSAGATNNTTIPEATIIPLPINGSAGPNNFVGSDADSVDNHLLVDEIPLDPADYTQSATVGHRDVFDVTNLTGSGATGNVLAVGVGASLQKTTAGARLANLGINSVAAASDSPAIGVAELEDYYEHIANVDPNTSSPWTYGAVDAMTVETEVV